MRRGSWARLVALAIAGMTLFAAPPAASADTPMSHSGMNAVHGLIDSTEYPGAICQYSGSEELIAIRVRAPIVYGLDLSGELDRTTVGWRAIVDRRAGTGPWERVAVSAIQYAQQTRDDQPARFTARNMAIAGEEGFGYRVLVRMLWYFDEKTLTQVGQATHRVDRYRMVAEIEDLCGGVLLH